MSTDNCSTIGGNTGAVDCGQRRGVPSFILIGGKSFTSTEYATADSFQDALIAATKLNTGDSNKLFAFPVINDVTNNTEADTTGSLSLGPNVRLRKGRPGYTYILQDVSHKQFQALLAFDNKIVPVFTYDDGNQMWGYRGVAPSNTTNENDFSGERALVTVSGNGFKDGKAVEVGQLTVTVSYLSITDFEKRSASIELNDLSDGDVKGLVDVMLSKVSNSTNVWKVKASIEQPKLNGDLNIGDDFGAAIAALTFTAFTGATYGTSLAITSTAYDATLKALTVTFDSTAYTALASAAKIKLVPPTATVLDAGDVPGYEIGVVILTKP